jgi:hypothetical protein
VDDKKKGEYKEMKMKMKMASQDHWGKKKKNERKVGVGAKECEKKRVKRLHA